MEIIIAGGRGKNQAQESENRPRREKLTFTRAAKDFSRAYLGCLTRCGPDFVTGGLSHSRGREK